MRLTATNNPHPDASYQTNSGPKYQTSMSLEKMIRWLDGDSNFLGGWDSAIQLINLRLTYKLVYYPPFEDSTSHEGFATGTWANPKNNLLWPLYDTVFNLERLEQSSEFDDMNINRLNSILNFEEAYLALSDNTDLPAVYSELATGAGLIDDPGPLDNFDENSRDSFI